MSAKDSDPIGKVASEIRSGKDSPSATETERMVNILHEALDRFAEHAGSAERQARSTADDVREGARRRAVRARDKGNEAANIVEEYVDDHPWTAAGIAFGAGIIVSSMLRR
jgi:ElaB/YqjD/DUF883 family membrane-anchored ribosome-binding protein